MGSRASRGLGARGEGLTSDVLTTSDGYRDHGLALTPDVSPSTDKVVVGLIDTVVQRNGTAVDPFLQASVAAFGGDRAPPSDAITHGTAMAETILDGVARALAERGDGTGKVPVSILPIDVYGASETTNTFDVARGIYEALNGHANIINMSLAGEGESPLLRNLIGTATEHGVLVFAAAGNTPGTTPMYPAADPAVIAVTAADAQGNVAPWANSGAFVDVIGPGMNVVRFQDRAWLGTGTSISTSWVSGWTAGVMAPRSSRRRRREHRRCCAGGWAPLVDAAARPRPAPLA
jgi:Subtilase family